MKKVITILILFAMITTSSIAFAVSDIGNLPAVEKVAIQELVDQGVLSGYTDGTFRPGEALQRQHFAKYIVNALGLEPYYPSKPTFPDVTTDMALYPYVEAAAKAGLIKGTATGLFEPTRSLKQGEAVVIIVRAVEGSVGSYAFQLARAKQLGLLGDNEDPGKQANRGGAAVSISKGIKLRGKAGQTESKPALTVPESTTQEQPISNKFIEAKVTKVVDGDTIYVLLSNGQEEKIRLIGVDTPESTTQIEPYGKEASTFTKNRLDGKTVYLEKDVDERDRYGRLLAYVWLERPKDDSDAEMRAKLFNAELLLAGYAQVMTIAPNVKYSSTFLSYQQQAREANKGLWGIDVAVSTTPTNTTPTNTTPTLPSDSDPTDNISGNTTGEVTIVSVSLSSEVVTIKNNSGIDVNMTGWKLVSETGNQTYNFPSGFVLKTGASVKVNSGKDAANNPPTDLRWTTANIWNNSGDPAALYDGSGKLISRKQ